MKKIVTFGEILLRLTPPGYLKLSQSNQLCMTFGGSETNVAVSLAHMGRSSEFVTKLPDNDIARAAVADLRSHDVAVDHIAKGGQRLGLYFYENTSSVRPSKVVYDRSNSSFCTAVKDDFDWKTIFAGAGWFHWSGIGPALSQSAADITLDAIEKAHEAGLTISADLNYRKNLWKYGKEAKEVMSELTKYVDVAIANEEDFQKSLGISAKSDVESGELDRDVYKQIAQTAMDLYPNLKKVAITLRESKSADTNYWAACIYDGKEFYVSRKYAITDIVDRVGGGDSFGGGLIYGLNTYATQAEALEFAVAASCLKHTISGDFNRVTVKEVESLMKGSGSGRVER